MVYRIRYRSMSQAQGEMVVEANSPTEAMIKFQHIRNEGKEGDRRNPSVTSVSAEANPHEKSW